MTQAPGLSIEESVMSNPEFAATPEPPYYAVIFASQRTPADAQGYAAMADRMVELAREQPGFLGVDSARGADGFGITVSYWASLDAIAQWRAHVEHQAAQTQGKRTWYAQYELRIALVERAYGQQTPGFAPVRADGGSTPSN